MKLLYLLGYLWALPVTLIGALIAVAADAKFSVRRPLGHFLFVASSSGGAEWFFRSAHMAATTIGAVTILANLSATLDERLLRHEFVHTKQAMLLGVLFPFAYYGASILAWARGRQFYFDNWFEIQARKAEEVKA